MSMHSEIAIEATIAVIVHEIERKLTKYKSDAYACSALKEIGRFALTQFEWGTPAWATAYEKLFKE